jgi:hypothetical protein
MGGMNKKRLTAIKGTMNHAKTSFSTEIFAGAIISVVQYLVPLRNIANTTNVIPSCILTKTFTTSICKALSIEAPKTTSQHDVRPALLSSQAE